MREWRCHTHVWQLLLSRRFPERAAFVPRCPTCGKYPRSNMTTVVHIKDAPVGWTRTDDPEQSHVYIGRPGRFGNPYRLRKDTDRNRKRLLRRYRRWLFCRLGKDSEFRADVAALAGSSLVCYCAPKPCHGDVLARAADWMAEGNVPEPVKNCGLHDR